VGHDEGRLGERQRGIEAGSVAVGILELATDGGGGAGCSMVGLGCWGECQREEVGQLALLVPSGGFVLDCHVCVNCGTVLAGCLL
jgi:hypothetical protein